MIAVNNVTVSFGGFTLLDNINFHVGDKDKIGLVGKNGAGKSTLLKLIAGISHPSSGDISMPSGMTVGYLPQQMEHSSGKTVMEETMTAFSHIDRMQSDLDRVIKEISERTDYESKEYHRLLVEMNDLNDRLSIMSSETRSAQCERALSGLGFKREDFDRPTSTFSQGWNMRIELAKILLKKPGVMLLDEPTNHLDIESISWLEDYLKNYNGSIVLISHDRRFLDNITNRTVEIMLGKIHDYKVPYSRYLELRKERIEQQKAAYENQRKMIEKTEEFIERFRYKPTKSNQVQSRIKQLEKLDRLQIDEVDNAVLNLKFPPAPRSGQVVFKSADTQAAYGSKVIFSHANVVVERGEKVVFVGRNGEGKTTMVRLIMGELQPREGECSVGHNVSIGYYAQNQEDVLAKEDTVFETLDRIAVGDIRKKLRDILGAFLFRGEDIDKKVAVLSGGERARLAMAKLMLNPYNLLVLDEPTNHMDIKSKDVLKQALKSYDGTLIMVSHDRDFLDGLVDKVYEFRDGKVKEHLGGISDFLEKLKIENLSDIEKKPEPKPKREAGNGSKNSEGQEVQHEKKNPGAQAGGRKIMLSSKQKNKIKKCEDRIAELEKQMQEIEDSLAAPSDEDDIVALSAKYNELKIELNACMDEWVACSSEF